MNKEKKKPIFYGALSSVVLLGFYGVTMTLLSGLNAAVEQFLALWWLMLPLSIGFGIQVSLYTKLKSAIKSKTKQTLATSGVTSSAGMLACCAHHLTDVLPFLGLSAVSIFLTKYQILILLVSIGVNIYGIVLMKKHLRMTSL